MIVIGNKRIIRLGVSVTYDTNAAANRLLDKKELFTVGKQVQFLFCKFETCIEYESIVQYARLSKIFKNIG